MAASKAAYSSAPSPRFKASTTLPKTCMAHMATLRVDMGTSRRSCVMWVNLRMSSRVSPHVAAAVSQSEVIVPWRGPMERVPCGMLSHTLISSGPSPEGGSMPAKTTPQPDDLRNPYGYSEMDWAAQLDPAYAAARAEVRRLSVGEDGALTVKVKEFVVLGVLASRGLQYGAEA